MKMYAFLGRYGHQDASSMGQMSFTDLNHLAKAIAAILDDEQAPRTGD